MMMRVYGVSNEELRRRNIRSNWDVVNSHALPGFLRDNEYLVRGHRPQLSSFTDCFRSAFRMHTETWNIWSHFIGSALFLVISIFYLSPYSHGSESSIEEKLPFAVFFAGAIFCMGSSSVFHMMSCHSESTNKMLAKLDYCGIIVLIVTSFAPWCYYCFYCQWHLKVLYLSMVSAFGALSIFCVCQKKFAQPRFRPLRAGLFSVLGLTGVLPFCHYVWLHPTYDGVYYGMYLVVMALLYLAGGAIYAVRFPERVKPGVFDILGQSHQILHLCVIVAALVCFSGASQLASYKLKETCTDSNLVNAS